MSYIAREDGEHFVIPSYRDVLTAKSTTAVKKEVMTLSQSYGEYITMQRKGQLQFEIAFSPDVGYLLGETVWYKFNRPVDMIYCEAIPNSTEAILVIVKNGSVYLDGSFPVDNIPEELVIFLTQQNNFEIFIYGDVPIAATSTEGKFSFDDSSVKSFTVLDEPVFNSLPLIAAYHLQPVDVTLKAVGIGGLPIQAVFIGIGGMILAMLTYSYVISPMFEEKKTQEIPMEVNPFAAYVSALNSTAPDEAMKAMLDELLVLQRAPGWYPVKMEYKTDTISATMFTQSGNMQKLYDFSQKNNLAITTKQAGVILSVKPKFAKRNKPKVIYPLKEVIITLIDKLFATNPNYALFNISDTKASGPFANSKITVRVQNLTPDIMVFMARQLEGLPLTIDSFSVNVHDGLLTGQFVIYAYGT